MIVFSVGAIGLVVAYFLGAIPTGYLAGRLFKGIDVRDYGSRSTGATNVLRTVGKWPAAAVLVVDVLKGALAVVFARWFCAWAHATTQEAFNLGAVMPWVVCLAGIFALVGHSKSVWLNFAGGKSVATGLGVLLATAWPVGTGAFAAFLVMLAATRIVSASSVIAAFSAIILVCSMEQPIAYRLLVIAGSGYVVVRHRANLRRLIAGTEPRLGQRDT